MIDVSSNTEGNIIVTVTEDNGSASVTVTDGTVSSVRDRADAIAERHNLHELATTTD